MRLEKFKNRFREGRKLKVTQQARRLFKVGDIETKQTPLSLISSNILIHDGKIASYQLNPVFSYLMKGAKHPESIDLSGREDSLRRFTPQDKLLVLIFNI